MDPLKSPLAAPTMRQHARPSPKRLLPNIVDFNAISFPTRVYALIPQSVSLSDGLQALTYEDFANAINRVSWWLDGVLGESLAFDTFAYIGPKDIRYSILAVATIKTCRKVLFPSPFSSRDGLESLLQATKCTTILCPAPISSVPLVERALTQRPDLRIVTVPALDEWLDPKPVPHFPYEKSFDEAENDPFMIIHTSGTTGSPKPLFYTNGCVAAYDAQRYLPEDNGPMWWHLITGKRIFSPMPTLHVAGIFTSLILPLFFDATLVLGPGDKPLSLDIVNQIHDLDVIDGGLYPPSILEEVCKSPESLEKIKKLGFVMFTGAPLSEASGGLLSSFLKVHNTIGSTELGVFPVYLAEQFEWLYFKFHPYFGYHMEPRGEGRYELIIRQDTELRPFQSVFHLYPDAKEYRTRDVFSPHPSKPDLWRYIGRVDDLIIFSHGEDLDPVNMESLIRQNPLVKAAVIGGHARNRPFLLIELMDSTTRSQETESQTLDKIWPSISEANTLCSEYVKLTRDLVTFTVPQRPLHRTLKGSVDRRKSLEDYRDEIDRLYAKPNGQPKDSQATTITSLCDERQSKGAIFESVTFDWQNYIEHRPTYSKTFMDLILSYHRNKKGSWLAAHDVGTGPGNVARDLAPHFDLVYVSDSSARNLDVARQRLSSTPWAGKYRFAVAQGEDQGWIPAQSVDLVTIGEAIHWMAADVAVDAAARILRPGGTLAIWLYGRAIVVDKARAADVLGRILEHMFDRFRPLTGLLLRGAQTLAAEMDNIGLPPALFAPGARRIKWNCDHPLLYGKADSSIGWLSAVRDDEFVEYQADQHFWEVQADRAWLEKYVDHLMPDVALTEPLRELYDELEDAIGGPGAVVKITWPVVLLLATRQEAVSV